MAERAAKAKEKKDLKQIFKELKSVSYTIKNRTQ